MGLIKERNNRRNFFYKLRISDEYNNIPQPYRTAIKDASFSGAQYLDYIDISDICELSEGEWVEFIKDICSAYHRYISQNFTDPFPPLREK